MASFGLDYEIDVNPVVMETEKSNIDTIKSTLNTDYDTYVENYNSLMSEWEGDLAGIFKMYNSVMQIKFTHSMSDSDTFGVSVENYALNAKKINADEERYD